MEFITKQLIVAVVAVFAYFIGAIVSYFYYKDIMNRKIMKKLQETPAP